MMESARQRQERLYRDELGDEALERVKTAFAERHACCWERSAGPHHPVCVNAEPDAPTPLIDGQETLV
jgi:hypothetical protein